MCVHVESYKSRQSIKMLLVLNESKVLTEIAITFWSQNQIILVFKRIYYKCQNHYNKGKKRTDL